MGLIQTNKNTEPLNMNKLLPLIVHLGCTLVVVQAINQITYMRLGPSHMILTTDTNYAILSPTLFSNRWTIVARNGDDFVFYSASLTRVNKRADELVADESALVEDAKARLLQVRETDAKGAPDMTLAIFFGSSSVMLPTNALSGRPLYHSTSISIDEVSQKNFSVFMEGFPAGIVRVFVIEEVVTFVYADNRLLMQPLSAEILNEHAFFPQFMRSTNLAKEHFDTYNSELNTIRRQLRELSGFSHQVEELRVNLAARYAEVLKQCEAQMVTLNADFQRDMSSLL